MSSRIPFGTVSDVYRMYSENSRQLPKIHITVKHIFLNLEFSWEGDEKIHENIGIFLSDLQDNYENS